MAKDTLVNQENVYHFYVTLIAIKKSINEINIK